MQRILPRKFQGACIWLVSLNNNQTGAPSREGGENRGRIETLTAGDWAYVTGGLEFFRVNDAASSCPSPSFILNELSLNYMSQGKVEYALQKSCYCDPLFKLYLNENRVYSTTFLSPKLLPSLYIYRVTV